MLLELFDNVVITVSSCSVLLKALDLVMHVESLAQRDRSPENTLNKKKDSRLQNNKLEVVLSHRRETDLRSQEG